MVLETVRNNPLYGGNEDAVRHHVCGLELLQEVIARLPDYLPYYEICVCGDNCLHNGQRLGTASSEHVLQHGHAVLPNCLHANVGLCPEFNLFVQRGVPVRLHRYMMFFSQSTCRRLKIASFWGDSILKL